MSRFDWDLLMEQAGLRVCGACELGEHQLCRKEFIGGQKCDCKVCGVASHSTERKRNEG